MKAVKKPSLEAESRDKRRVMLKSTVNYTYSNPRRAAPPSFSQNPNFSEIPSWGEENGENTLHEPATATTKPKRTTQTKETSWHTPAVIYRLAVNAEDSEH